MNIKDTIEKNHDDFCDRFPPKHDDYCAFPIIMDAKCDCGADEEINKQRSYLKTAQLQLLQSVLDSIEGEETYNHLKDGDQSWHEYGGCWDEFNESIGFNTALNTIALPIREQINRLTE